MTDVVCYVRECQFYKGGYCSESDITISENGDCFTFQFSEDEPQDIEDEDGEDEQ